MAGPVGPVLLGLKTPESRRVFPAPAVPVACSPIAGWHGAGPRPAIMGRCTDAARDPPEGRSLALALLLASG